MKKILSLIAMVIVMCMFSACGNNTVCSIDYESVSALEEDLNNGVDVKDKVVTLIVDKFIPDSSFGYNILTGEHLNFCSNDNPKVNIGDTVTVKITDYSNLLGSWIISYKFY